MSKKQRRDHQVVLRQCRCMDRKGPGHHGPQCDVCGDEVILVKGREHHKQTRYRVADHWRHVRRWHREPLR